MMKIPISDREIGLFTDEQKIRDLFLNFPQGVYHTPFDQGDIGRYFFKKTKKTWEKKTPDDDYTLGLHYALFDEELGQVEVWA